MPSQQKKSEWKCIKCGRCCKVFTKKVKNKEEIDEQGIWGFKVKDSSMKVVITGRCEHLKNNRCMIYDKRPQRCKDYFCRRYVNAIWAKGQMYQKRCLVCNKIRTFQAGTARDKQSICGNCWVWE